MLCSAHQATKQCRSGGEASERSDLLRAEVENPFSANAAPKLKTRGTRFLDSFLLGNDANQIPSLANHPKNLVSLGPLMCNLNKAMT